MSGRRIGRFAALVTGAIGRSTAPVPVAFEPWVQPEKTAGPALCIKPTGANCVIYNRCNKPTEIAAYFLTGVANLPIE